MANERVIFRRGTSTTLPSEKVPGTIYITTDTGEMFVDDTTDSRVQVITQSDYAQVDVAMSDTSVHPVQNKVIKTYVDSLIIDDGSID